MCNSTMTLQQCHKLPSIHRWKESKQNARETAAAPSKQIPTGGRKCSAQIGSNEGPFTQKKHLLSYELLLSNSFICTCEKPRKHAATILSTLHLQQLPDTDDNQVALAAILPGRGHQEFDLRKTRARARRHKLVPVVDYNGSGHCLV